MLSKLPGRGLVAILLVCGAVWGCNECDAPAEDEQRTSDARPDDDPKTRAFDRPEARDLTDFDTIEEGRATISDAERFEDCHEIFEPDQTPASRLPVAQHDLPRTLVGCGAEASHRLDDDWLIAYRVPANDASRDLRLVRYNPAGRLKWHQTLDRSDHADNFRADFLDSFITPLPPDMLCYGTRWMDETSASCLTADTGERRWEGTIDVWLGVEPLGLDKKLVSATREGLTRRYPYSGTEMRFKSFEEPGGHSAFYTADSTRLFYVPAKDDPYAMTAFDLETLDPIWRLELPERPSRNFAHAFERFDLVLFVVDETIHAVDTDSGQIRWAAHIGADQAPVAAAGDRLLVLMQREEEPSALVAIDPDDGRALWQLELPSGILEMHALDDSLFVKSVRAVREVRDLE